MMSVQTNWQYYRQLSQHPRSMSIVPFSGFMLERGKNQMYNTKIAFWCPYLWQKAGPSIILSPPGFVLCPEQWVVLTLRKFKNSNSLELKLMYRQYSNRTVGIISNLASTRLYSQQLPGISHFFCRIRSTAVMEAHSPTKALATH